MQASLYSANESQNRSCIGHKYRLHHQLAASIEYGCRDTCLVYVQTNKLNVTHEGAPFVSSWVFEDHCRLLSKGALLYCVADPFSVAFGFCDHSETAGAVSFP